MATPTDTVPYPARFDIDYTEERNRVTVLFRLILAIPIMILIGILSAQSSNTWTSSSGETFTNTSAGITGALFLATLLMILFRQRYPRWWFDFALEFNRFGARVWSYAGIMTDDYPSTEDQQRVHLDLDYPDAEHDLNRWLPLVKWFLAIPHYIVLFFLWIGALVVTIIAWFAILFTGTYPRGLFDFVVGVQRWTLRVTAYAFLLITDQYPPFSLD